MSHPCSNSFSFFVSLAPVTDLRNALQAGSLKSLNPFPWSFMTGNCLGWVIYAYYTNDPFVLAANVPGLILSIWLNFGAAKLQYTARYALLTRLLQRQGEAEDEERSSPVAANEEHWDASPDAVEANPLVEGEADHNGLLRYQDDFPSLESLVMVPQEVALLRILVVWAVTAISVGWLVPLSSRQAATVVGLLVNGNLVVFYSAPLQSLRLVLKTKHSDSIHRPTLYMNYMNTSFWMLYGGFVRRDVMIVLPNGIGFALGVAQGLLCLWYPRKGSRTSSSSIIEPHESVPSGEEEELS
jgi:solute carrier family 50 protein (sugar transporter)